VRALSLNGLRKQVEDHFAGQDLDMRRREASSPGQLVNSGMSKRKEGSRSVTAITKCLLWVAAGEPVHSDGEGVAPVWPPQRRMVRAGLMDKDHEQDQ